MVVALGGGSPMCAGKGIALVAANGGSLTDYEGFNKAAKAPYPVIAVPTTAGSGTEVSKVTILTDEARSFKMSILDERTFPQVAILDASLMASLPAWPALVAGMDALAHALDAIWSSGPPTSRTTSRRPPPRPSSRSLPTSALTGDSDGEAAHARGELDREHGYRHGPARSGARPLAAARPPAPVARVGDGDHAALCAGVQLPGRRAQDRAGRAASGRSRRRQGARREAPRADPRSSCRSRFPDQP